MSFVIIIGAGLAGVEAAWQLARRGIKVKLYEAKPKWFSPAHKSEDFAELVCSNSLKSEEEGHATALLKEEMRALNSLVLEAADATRLPAGKALAVDREGFSKFITEKICSHSCIEVVREEVKTVEEVRSLIIATGPLTSPSLAASLQSLFSSTSTLKHSNTSTLYFYDAIAPIVEVGSIAMDSVFRASRYGVGKKGDGDYLNCPLTKYEYYKFIEAILGAKKVGTHMFEEIRCFEGCQPIEVMAASHRDSLRHGPMKPMGLSDPRTGGVPYAVVQLRQDNIHATLYNIVGFQTRMTYPEQDRVFRMIPGLEGARFARYGSMHRNTYLNGPALLDETLQLKSHPGIYIAGQLTGVEGYLESAATGLYAGLAVSELMIFRSCDLAIPPTTAIGALVHHITHADLDNYQPMNMIWGIFPLLSEYSSTSAKPDRVRRRALLLSRARTDFRNWLDNLT